MYRHMFLLLSVLSHPRRADTESEDRLLYLSSSILFFSNDIQDLGCIPE